MSLQKQKYYSYRNLSFLLYEMLDISMLTRHTYFAAHDRETIDAVLNTAESIAEKILRPAFAESDRKPPELIKGKVSVHPALHAYYKVYVDSGLITASLDQQYGGQQLPETAYAAVDFILGNAHNGFEMFTNLAHHAARLLISHASPQLVQEYVTKLLDGSYTATMCLTETGAGSSLNDITTEATPLQNGAYSMQGQKIFISAGDHDITENIVHLVLARTKGAPKGVKGISLFVVPKKTMADNKWKDNDVVSIGVYHKMGQRGTPAMHLEFGGKNDCTGWLIGEEGKGLLYMFRMMNGARLQTGLAATYIASAAYYVSLQYAGERVQGRRANNKKNEAPVTIIHHPDVRRMLLLQKATVEGCLAFALQCYYYTDLQKISGNEATQRYKDLLELLTPVVKACGAEMCIESVSNGMQVLGGYGYTQDFMLEQLYRDIRVMSLYEGTTGIQSQALLGRQVTINEGRALRYWKEEVIADVAKAKQYNELHPYVDQLSKGMEQFEAVTTHLLDIASKGNEEIFLSDANLYMELFGLVNLGWVWLKQATAAQEALIKNEITGEDKQFYRSKIETMQFFFHYMLIKTKSLVTRLLDEKILTVFKEEEILM